MTTLVTGGSGYFGETVVQRLLARGDRVRILDLVENPDKPDGVEIVRGDVRDEAIVRRAFVGVSVVHHNVAQVPLAKDREQFWSVNVEGTRNVLAAALDAGVRKVILTSSSAVYGVPEHNPVTRETVPRPREAYGAAKLEGEHLAQRYVDRGLDVTIVRPRTVLGHGRLGIFQVLFEWIRTGKPVYLMGSGHNKYQFVHADDLADVCLAADEREGPAVYLAGAADFGTMRELLEGLVHHAGTGSPVRSLPARPAELAMNATAALGLSPLGPYHALMYGRELYFDIEPTRRELDWEPRYGSSAMIAESYDWYVANRDDVLARSGASHHRSPVKLGALKLLELLP